MHKTGFLQRVLPPAPADEPMMAGAADKGDENQFIPAAGAPAEGSCGTCSSTGYETITRRVNYGTYFFPQYYETVLSRICPDCDGTGSSTTYRSLAAEFGTPACPKSRTVTAGASEAVVNLGRHVATEVTTGLVTSGAGKALTVTSTGVLAVVVKLTSGGTKKIRNLQHLKDINICDAIRQRGGYQSQVNEVATHLKSKTVGELANMAAKGDAEAETAIKLVKQASSKAQDHRGK